jgi:hypothetical protein
VALKISPSLLIDAELILLKSSPNPACIGTYLIILTLAVRHHRVQPITVYPVQHPRLPESTLPATILARQQMAKVSLFMRYFAGLGELEAFGRAPVGLDFRHVSEAHSFLSGPTRGIRLGTAS